MTSDELKKRFDKYHILKAWDDNNETGVVLSKNPVKNKMVRLDIYFSKENFENSFDVVPDQFENIRIASKRYKQVFDELSSMRIVY